MCICSRNKKQRLPYVDPDREQYRKLFNIEDDYLIEYYYETVNGNTEGYIVYIDPENDIDWKDTRDKSQWSADEKVQWSTAIAKLDNAHSEPTGNLSRNIIRTFKVRLGAGYVLAMEKNFEAVDEVISESLSYLHKRNAESARFWLLISSSVILAVSLMLFFIFLWTNNRFSIEWLYAIEFGLVGSYFSIWSRYGKLKLSGLSSLSLNIIEGIVRMIIGALSASVMMLAFKSKYILPNFSDMAIPYINGLIGFAGGFCERLVPSIMEKFVDAKQSIQ